MSETTTFYSSWLGNGSFGANSVRLREIEPVVFKPTDISGCALWLDATDNDAVIYNNLLQVSAWKNKGYLGGQFDASGAGLVEYGAAQQNGFNTVTFQSGGYLTGTYNLDFQARSIFVVVKPVTVTDNSAVSILTADTTNLQELFFLKSSTWLWFLGKHPSVIPEEAFESATNYTGYANLATFVLADYTDYNWTGINGTYIAPIYNTVANFATGSATYFLGNYANGAPIDAQYDVCEIIIYNNALLEVDRVAVETYLLRRWNLQEPPPPPFVPTDISGLYLWMDGNNLSTLTLAGSNVSSWSNQGLAGSTLDADSNTVYAVTGSNGNGMVEFPSEATLLGYMQFPYMTRTAFVAFENLTSLDTITYPYENLFDTGTLGGRQLGFNYDSNTTTYFMQLCQQGYNCPASGALPTPLSTGGVNLGIWGVDSNTYLSSICYFNGGSNLNTDSNGPNLFNTSSINYYIGSPVTDSPSFRIGEILEYDSLLDISQISTVANYLVTKWAISSFTPVV